MRRILYAAILLLILIPAMIAAQDIPKPVQAALDDLSSRLGQHLSAADVTWSYEQNVYDDSSLGCPQTGINYFKGKTIGYRVLIEVQGTTYDYRVAPDLHVIPCSQPLTGAPTGTPAPDRTRRPLPVPTLTPMGTRFFRPTTTLPAPNDLCANSLPTRLNRTGKARVLPGITTDLFKIMNWPERLEPLTAGKVLELQDGPFCSGGIIWWKAFDPMFGREGYIRESDGSAYLFEPMSGAFASPSPTPPYLICPDSPPSRLTMGGYAQVLQSTIVLYGNVGETDQILTQLTAGRIVATVYGLCSDNAIWWNVVEMQTRRTGWVKETEGRSYLLEPLNLPDGTFPTAAPGSLFPTAQPVAPTGRAFPTNPPPFPTRTPSFSGRNVPTSTPVGG